MTEFYTQGDTLVLSEKSEIILTKCLVKESIDLHKHRFIEIAYVDEGSGTHEIGDGYVSHIDKGDVMLFNAGVAHGYRVEPPASLTIYNCLFDPSVLDASVSESDDFINIVYDYLFETASARGNDQKPYILIHGAETVSEIIKNMYREYTSKQNGYSKVNAANLIRLLISIFRLKRDSEGRDVAAYKAAIAESAMRYINSSYSGKISCGMLASRAFVSTGYFHKLFKEATGLTPVEYIQEVRLAEASRLLRETTMSVETAAGSVGYSDLKYFYELLKKKYGLTPNEYRKKIRGNAKTG